MPTAKINGIDMYYEIHGSGFPLLFSHGGFGGLGTGAHAEPPAWVPEFSKHFQVILYDRRSAGRSEFPETHHSMDLFAHDARELLRHLGHDRAHKWGASGGGPPTLEFGFQHPDAAQTLLLHCTSPKFWNEEDDEERHQFNRLKERIQILQTKGPEAAYEARRAGGTVGLLTFRESRPVIQEGDDLDRQKRRAMLTAMLNSVPIEERIRKYAGELRTYSAYADWSGRLRMGQLKMPILIVYSPDETMLPNARWEEMTEGMPNVTYLPVPGVDHGGEMAVPGVTEKMLEFLIRNTPKE